MVQGFASSLIIFVPFCVTFVLVDALVGASKDFGVSFKIIQIPQGSVQGTSMLLPTKKRVDAYFGIPYAKAGRFEAPRPAENWPSLLNATKYGKPCPQPLNPQLRNFDSMSEDCLFMNIFVPTGNNETLMPVMFYVHGGAFVFRSGQTDFSIFASEGNVIVVSFNYRLGALGFLSLGSRNEQIASNFGMLDQVVALKWVHRNIESFGGDPNKITLFGSSSGSTCVSLLMLSPLITGLYSNVILSSGSAHAIFATVKPQTALTRTRKFLNILGCKEEEAMKCLRRTNLTFPEIINAQMQINATSILLPFGPVVDGKFLTDEPATLLNKGNFDPTNVMIGVTQDEGSVFLTPIPGIVKGVPSIEKGMSAVAFREAVEEGIWTRDQDNRILKSIIYEYTDWANQENLNITRQNFLNIGSDAGFKAPAVLSAKAFARKGIRTYLYQFEHASKHMNAAEVPFWKGVYHRADVHYVLGAPIRNGPGSNDTEVTFSTKIIQLWTDFARTGSPTRTTDSFHWPRFNVQTQLYAALKPEFAIRSHLFASKMAFWNELVPSLSRSDEQEVSPSSTLTCPPTATCARCPSVTSAPCDNCSGRFIDKIADYRYFLLQWILIGAVVGLTIMVVIIIIVTVHYIRKSRKKQKLEEYEIVATNL